MERYTPRSCGTTRCCARMGEAARKSASERFSMDAIFRQWLSVYELGSDRYRPKPVEEDELSHYETRRRPNRITERITERITDRPTYPFCKTHMDTSIASDKLVYNGRFTSQKSTGVQRVARELIAALGKIGGRTLKGLVTYYQVGNEYDNWTILGANRSGEHPSVGL